MLESFGLAPGRARGESLLAEEIAAERIVPQILRESGQPRHWWSVTSQSYRLVVGDGEKRLYDVRADPEERNDVASSHPDLVAELERRLQEFLDRAPGEALERTEDPLDEETLRGLKALGYGGE